MHDQHESVILNLTDIHTGKKTHSYDHYETEARLARVGERVDRIFDLISREIAVDELIIALLGDVVDGDGIYPGQPHYQSVSNVEEQARLAADFLGDFVMKRLQHWPFVRVAMIPGNHGRVGKHAHESASWDRTAYRYLSYQIQDECPIHVPEPGTDQFLLPLQVKGHTHLLYHGHDIKGVNGLPFGGITQRIMRWATANRWGPISTVNMGHFHTSAQFDINGIRAFMNGTMVSHDEWAFRALGWESSNTTWMYGVSESRPVTFQYSIDLT